MLSNLLQELALARDHGRKRIVLDEARLTENPVDRLSRMIKNSFWHALTRRIDGDGLEIICADPKNRTGRVNPRIYVPHGEPAMAEYYRRVAAEKPHLNLDVQVLPATPDDAHFVKSLNHKPGILALAMNEVSDGQTLKGIPFVVPGARFNEVALKAAIYVAVGVPTLDFDTLLLLLLHYTGRMCMVLLCEYITLHPDYMPEKGTGGIRTTPT